jgi:hypothetical protein
VSAIAVPPIARVAEPGDVPAALTALDIAIPRPVLVLVGGAGGMSPGQQAIMAEAMKRLVPALGRWGAAVVDGGTDSGVMQVMGQARGAAGGSFPLIGVAAEGTVTLPGTPPADGMARLEPHHTHIILVPGATWGDESPWLSSIARAIADRQPSLTLVVNGGQLTYEDIGHSLRAGRPVIVLAGTGRTANAIAAAALGRPGDPRAARVAASPEARIVSLDDPDALCSAIASILAPSG